MLKIGITGGIATGKSYTASVFAEYGFAVFNADIEIAKLFEEDFEARAFLKQQFPHCWGGARFDKELFFQHILQKESDFLLWEDYAHKKIYHKQLAFCDYAKTHHLEKLVFDIPLLFETKYKIDYDYICLTHCDAALQKERALTRAHFTEEKWHFITKRQMPFHQKKNDADFIIDTTYGFEASLNQIEAIIRKILS